jgi:hypothetical protein
MNLAPRGCRSWEREGQLIVGLGSSIDDVQMSGQWISTADPVEVEQ